MMDEDLAQLGAYVRTCSIQLQMEEGPRTAELRTRARADQCHIPEQLTQRESIQTPAVTAQSGDGTRRTRPGDGKRWK
jgi:hypothetical protein